MLAGNCSTPTTLSLSRPKHNKNNSINAHVRLTRLRPRPRLRLRLWQMGHKLETNPQAACDPLTGTSPALSLPVSLPLSNLCCCCCCCGLSGSSSNPKPHSKRITVRKRKKQERQRTLRGRQSVNKCRRDETTRAEPSRAKTRQRERESDPIRSCLSAQLLPEHRTTGAY